MFNIIRIGPPCILYKLYVTSFMTSLTYVPPRFNGERK